MTTMSTEPAAMVGSGELSIIYGTAWKLDATLTNVKQALTAGFRAFDTAAQPKHYREDLVGQAVREIILDGRVARGDLYVSLSKMSYHLAMGGSACAKAS